MRVHPVPDIGDVLLKDTDWSQSPVLKGIYDSMRHDATTEAAKAADLALDNQDLRAVVVFIVETLVLNEDVARSCLGRRSIVAACRFLASYAQTVDGRVWRFTDQAKRVAKLRAATGPGCGRFGVSRSRDAKYGSLVEARLACDQNGPRRGAAFVCDELLAAALSDFTCDEWPDDGAVLDAPRRSPDGVAGARGRAAGRRRRRFRVGFCCNSLVAAFLKKTFWLIRQSGFRMIFSCSLHTRGAKIPSS